MTLGRRIRAARERLTPKLTQKDVATAFSVTEQAVSQWERDQGFPDFAKMPELRRLLKVTYAWLLDGGDTPPPDENSMEVSLERLTPAERNIANVGGHPSVSVTHAKLFSGSREGQYRLTFIRQWRKHRGLTLEELAACAGTTHASLSRVERGRQAYTQPLLEALANALQTDPASLLICDPTDPEAIWSIWEQARPRERRQIVEIAKTLLEID